jgi:hypothetical protein
MFTQLLRAELHLPEISFSLAYLTSQLYCYHVSLPEFMDTTTTATDGPQPDKTPLRLAASSLLADIAAQKPSVDLLSHFSTTQPIVLQHDCVDSINPCTFSGPHAVRSYFDLLALHWTRDDVQLHECTIDEDNRRVVATATTQWRWRVSGESWREDFTCTLDFDERLKVTGFIVHSSPPETNCIMHATDTPRL